MSAKSVSFDEYVVKSILASNQFGITAVNNLESLKSVFFVNDQYPVIEELIKAKNIEAIRILNEEQPRTEEYLDIMMFKDQHEKEYIVTVYDNNALEQDPQVVEIYLL